MKEKLQVFKDNEHFGLVVSGTDEDKNINSARKTMFALLGNVFSYKWKIAPTVHLHLYSLYIIKIVNGNSKQL